MKFNTTEPDNVDRTGLVGFDAAGHIRWAMRYSFGAPGAYARSGPTAVHLSDDGGVLVTAVVDNPAQFDAGRLWAFKPFAKDGSIDFAPGSVTATALGITNLPCSMSDSDLAVTFTPVDVPSRAVAVGSTPVILTEGQQTGG